MTEECDPVPLADELENLRRQLESVRTSEGHYKDLFEGAPVPLWEQDLSVSRKRIEQLRADGVTDLQAHFERHPEFVTGCLSTTVVSAVNRMALELYRMDRAEFLRYGLTAIIGERNVAGFAGQLLAIAHQENVYEGEVVTHTLSGEDRRVVLRWVVPAGYEGTLAKVLVSALDVTERHDEHKVQEHRALKAQQVSKLESLGDLAGRIAHDFNNVLMAILGYSDILIGKLDEHSGEQVIAKQIENAAVRAADLTKQLVTYAGKSRAILNGLSLTRLVKDAEGTIRSRSLLKSVVKYDLTEETLPIQGDDTQIRQILLALVENAVEAIGDRPGVITIRTGHMQCGYDYLRHLYGGEGLPEGAYAYVELVDTGCGMEAGTLSQLFIPFFTTKSHERGLGLSVVLGIMKGHRGAVAVRSEEGVGTSFRLLFPIALVPANMERKPAPDERWKATGTVLVIDDEWMIRDVLKYMLDRIGFKVLLAPDGAAGVELYRANMNEIVVVLLDIIMPGMTSEETFLEIKRTSRHARVVLSSGSPEDVARDRFGAKDIAGFIHKPYKLQDLSATLQRIITENPPTAA